MTDVGTVYYGDTVAFETATAGATDLLASDGASVDSVTLTWSAPAQATGFVIYRDGEELARVDHDSEAREVEYVDNTAAEAGLPGLPATFSATSGGQSDGTLFTWTDPTPGEVAPHAYAVATLYDEVETAPSAEDSGFRAAQVVDGFSLEFELVSESFAGDVREYLFDSPLGRFDSVLATATTDRALVELRCAITGPSPGESVSAALVLLSGGVEIARSEFAEGFRGVGERTVRWERREAPETEFSTLPDVVGESTTDPSPPTSLAEYRCIAAADGAQSLTSEPVEGGTSIAPEVLTGTVTAPLDGEVIASPSVVADGRPLQTSVGYCWGTEPNPSLGGDATCVDLGRTLAGEDLRIPLSPVIATTVYFGRVYAEYELGIVYGEDVSFGGLIPGPAVVNATDGERDTDVTVTWSDVEGAVSYDVLRDNVLIRTGLTDALGLVVVDDLAPTPPLPLSEDIELQASQGSTTDGVSLNWTAPSTAPGASATYTVVANFADGSQSLPTSDTGFRAAAVVTGYEVYRDGDFAGVAGVSREFLDTEAPLGSYTAGTANASDGTSSTFVALTVSGEVFTPGAESDFWVVPTGDGFVGDASVEATGFRAAPDVTYVWTFSDTGANGFFDPLGLVTREADDTTAPANGDPRWYRLVTVLEPENQVSGVDSGFLNVNLAGVETGPISELAGRAATLTGDATSLGSPTPTDHGFCYGTSTAPALMDGSSTCVQLGALGSTGPFSTAVTDLPPAGTAFVRAFLTNTAGTAYGSAVAFSSQPDTPADVTATQGQFIDRVVVTWSDVQGATSYRITSDSGIDEIVNVGDAFVDSDAPAGGRPTNIGLGLNASDGTAPDAVVLTWSLPEVQQGDPVTYTVVAVNEFAESLPSDPVTGWRTGPAVTAYQIRINDDDWLDVGDVTRFDHVDADAGMVTGAVATATDGNAAASVRLSLTSIDVTDGEPETYRVRAVAGGAAGSASPPEDGFRAASQPSIQWERSITGAAGTFTSVSGATSASFADTTAPANGDIRFYRARLTQSNSFETNVDVGFRSAAPSVQTLDAVLGDAGIDVTWSLSALGGPAATAHGACISTSPAPSLENGASCQSLADPAATGTFSTTFVGLNAGTTYYARAFALNEVSTVYGAERTALTLPGAPTSVVATDGTRSDGVLITFTPGAGATSHALLRDGEVVATGISSGFVDNSAPAGGVPTGDMTVAAEGTASSVLLAWTAPSVPGASPSTFSVIPTNASGAGPVSSPDTGFRSGSPVQEYQVSVNGGSWVSTGATRSYTDTTAVAGQLIGGAANASDGTSSSFVSLNASGVAVGSGTASSYEVRAINVIGTGAPTPSVTGSRTAGTPTYQWQFGSAAGGPWNPLSGATALTFNDTSAPVNGDPRFYRLRVSATGSTTVFSSVDSGFRSANVPSVTTTGAAVGATAASFSGELSSLGTPAAFDHGFCYSDVVTNPTPDNATCVSLGAPSALGGFGQTVTGLTRGTLYTYSAYAENAAGLALGGPLMFVTAPDAPTNLVANGTSSSIALSWDAAPSATTYVVQRNGVAIATVTATSYSDTSAPLPVTPGGSDVVITKTGVSSTSISLAFSLPSVLPDGVSQSYRVVARNDAGDSPASGEAVGAVQGAPGIALWQIERDGVDYGASGTTSFEDNDPNLAELVDLDLGASDGTRTDGVQVIAPDVTIDDRPHTYRVRAGALNGVIGEWSEPFTTSVDVGALVYQWQRSNGDSPNGFVTAVTNGDDSVLDTLAPVNGRGRFYRVIVSAPGAETATSASDRGWRLPADCSAGPDEPDENNLDCDGDGIDGQIAGTIFVNQNSTAAGTPDGSFARPYRTIQDGLDEADGGNAPIYVAKGQYEESLFILDVSFDMWGGFSDGFLNHDPATFISHIDSPSDRGLVYSGSDREALLDGFLITASDASTNASSIGLLVDDFNDLLFVSNCIIEAGDGRNGADGASGRDGRDGGDGAPGLNGSPTSGSGGGGAPGVNICGTPGGFGGPGGVPGGAGEAGSGGTGDAPNGRPGSLVGGGLGYSPTFTCSGSATRGRVGNRGLSGEPGRPGLALAAMRYGEVQGASADWVALDGPDGASGTAGGGGSGGGGGGGVSGAFCTDTGGNGGGGGGAGGCGATGGQGGEGGGGSIALLASGGNAPALTSVVLVTGSGGEGGSGGGRGEGGRGGEGGVGATGGTAQVGDGADGGNGGAGGDGGSGAGGAGGMSVGLLLHNTNLSDAPVISTTLGTAGAGGAAGPTLFGLDAAPNGIRAAILDLDEVNRVAGAACSSDNQCADGFCVTGICYPAGMQPVEGGSFLMGAVPGDPDDRSNERPQHEVSISYDYFIGEYEMTTEEWRRYYGHNSTGSSCGLNCPLTQMTWYEALDVANRRSAAEGLTQCYDLSVCTGTSWRGDLDCDDDLNVDLACDGYRVPTEAEWEYVARSGLTNRIWGHGDDISELSLYAVFDSDVTNVGTRSANTYGVKDMAGNGPEWVWDEHDSYPTGGAIDPTGPVPNDGGGEHTIRGANGKAGPEDMRSSARAGFDSDDDDGGVRLVRTVGTLGGM